MSSFRDKPRVDSVKVLEYDFMQKKARNLAEEFKPTKGRFRRPLDTPAHRIAVEYVSNYLVSNLMTNTIQILGKETDNYIRQRHDGHWIANKLRVDDADDLYDQLIDCEAHGSTNSRAGTKEKEKEKCGFLESRDFSEFTEILTTNAGAEFTIEPAPTPQSTSTPAFSELCENSAEKSTYDPRGMKAPPKPLPKVPRKELYKSKFRGRTEEIVSDRNIDTIKNSEDLEQHNKMKAAIGALVSEGELDTRATQESTTMEDLLKPLPRDEVINSKTKTITDTTWASLEHIPTESTFVVPECPFAKQFKDIVTKKKLITMGVQTLKQPNVPSDQ